MAGKWTIAEGIPVCLFVRRAKLKPTTNTNRKPSKLHSVKLHAKQSRINYYENPKEHQKRYVHTIVTEVEKN